MLPKSFEISPKWQSPNLFTLLRVAADFIKGYIRAKFKRKEIISEK